MNTGNMDKHDDPEKGRRMVVSSKVSEALVSIIDSEARRKIKDRASWLREAILEKLVRDGAVTVERTDPFDLAAVMG